MFTKTKKLELPGHNSSIHTIYCNDILNCTSVISIEFAKYIRFPIKFMRLWNLDIESEGYNFNRNWIHKTNNRMEFVDHGQYFIRTWHGPNGKEIERLLDGCNRHIETSHFTGSTSSPEEEEMKFSFGKLASMK
jgi:hypothetical protein